MTTGKEQEEGEIMYEVQHAYLHGYSIETYVLCV